MPRYQMYFLLPGREIQRRAQINDEETLTEVMPEILQELRETEGAVLEGQGNPKVESNGKVLLWSKCLPPQGVRPEDVLRVSLIPENG
jgi:hypothetical protein